MNLYKEEIGEDSDNETDPEQLMNEWLNELDSLTVSLNNVNCATLRSYNSDINTPRIDSYRISMANLEDSQDVDLDAILGELCALEQRCKSDITSTPNLDNQMQIRQTNGKSNSGESTDIGKNEGIRTDSPDNDSAFSDTVSMLSSESSTSSSGSGHKSHQPSIHQTSQQQQSQLIDVASRAKAEKIRLALEKMREASVQKLFIKVFTLDGSGKSLLVDENMNVAHVCRLLADKNHVSMDPKWVVVEQLPDLFIERVYEDHELLVENLLMWTRDSKNKLLFMERPDKTQLFVTPERFLLRPSDRNNGEYDDDSRNILLEEFFSSNNTGVPEVEGPLYLKSDSKKGWKRYQFILRASGLYYWPKEKARMARDLVCLATFDVNQVYYAIGWKKKYKAPTDFCFAIKHPRLQQAKSTKYVKFLCAEDKEALERWIVGIRIAKYGVKLMENYRTLMDELAQEDLDLLAHARSCSVSSIAVDSQTTNHHTQYSTANDNVRHFNESTKYKGAEIPPSLGLNKYYRPSSEQRQSYASDGRLSRSSSSSSSGCLSDGTPSSIEVAFECGEFPTGTIKRKPSMNPKLPLTSITRQLKEVGETVRDVPDCSSPTNSGSSTLTRRHSRRRSGTESDGSGTLKRHHISRNATASSPIPPETPIRDVIGQLDRAGPTNLIHNENQQESKSPTDPIQPCMILYKAPLTPSLPHTTGKIDESYNEPLPPPPPEMFRSNLSLDSLPPPPDPRELLCDAFELADSCLNLTSLPPPPPSPLIGKTGIFRCTKTESQITPTLTTELVPAEASTAETSFYVLGLNNSNEGSFLVGSLPNSSITMSCHVASHQSPFVPAPVYGSHLSSHPARSGTHQYHQEQQYHQLPTDLAQTTDTTLRSTLKPTMTTVSPTTMTTATDHYAMQSQFIESKVCKSPQAQHGVNIQETTSSPRPSKKISFILPVLYQQKQSQFQQQQQQQQQQQPGSPALPQRKPLPPQRSNSTRLTSPKKLAVSEQAPPNDFLKDLQRVMRKKWQVAQKCKLDTTMTPHEVLGFRDPPPAVADYRETNVSNWVQEHYGADNLYENVYITDQVDPDSSSAPRTQQYNVRFMEEPKHSFVASAIASKRRPPPPPPKRAETTQLTSRFSH